MFFSYRLVKCTQQSIMSKLSSLSVSRPSNGICVYSFLQFYAFVCCLLVQRPRRGSKINYQYLLLFSNQYLSSWSFRWEQVNLNNIKQTKQTNKTNKASKSGPCVDVGLIHFSRALSSTPAWGVTVHNLMYVQNEIHFLDLLKCIYMIFI